MPAFNSVRYIGAAIESVLAQTGVDFELIVVDDGSADDTAGVVRGFKDPRIKLLVNGRNRGISFSHNLVLAHSTAPFVAHVDSDDLVLPGAFMTMLQAMESDPRVGQAHCYFREIDGSGAAAQSHPRARRSRFHINRPRGIDYKHELLTRGSVINHLRTYRREVFAAVGGFDERIRYGEDFEMALRIIDRFEIKLVPEFLYCQRIHPQSATERARCTSVGFLWQRYRICRRLAKNQRVSFLNEPRYRPGRHALVNLYRIMSEGLQ
jgi:glycosyltransferase involved in cell wall biosynthesis